MSPAPDPRRRGDGPAFLGPGVDRLRLAFQGRTGDLVRLDHAPDGPVPCRRLMLRRHGRAVAPTYDGIWRLPSTGRFTFVLRRCADVTKGREQVQLIKMRVRRLTVDGREVGLPRRRSAAYDDAWAMRVPAQGRVQVRSVSRSDAPFDVLYVPHAPRRSVSSWHQDWMPTAVFLAAGTPVANERAEMASDGTSIVPRAGQTVLLTRGDPASRAVATRTHTDRGALDVAPLRVRAEHAFEEVGASFWSRGDQWVTAVVAGRLGARSLRDLALVGPDGRTVVGLNQASSDHTVPDLWPVSAPGRYRLLVRSDRRHRTGTVALRTVRTIDAPVPDDGSVLTVTAAKPGEWILATGDVPAGFRDVRVTAGGVDWRVDAHTLPFEPCRSAFCDAFGGTHVLPGKGPGLVRGPGRFAYLVAFGAGHGGTVQLNLGPMTSLPFP